MLNEASRQGSGYYSNYGWHGGYYGRPVSELPAPGIPAQVNGNRVNVNRVNGNGSALAADHGKHRGAG